MYGAGGACLPTATITLPSGATGMGADVTLNNHNDNQAHLLTRSATQADPVTEVDPLADGLNASGFLAWFPPSQSNGGVDSGAGIPIETVTATLEQDFQDEIYGVHEYGCGIESQLESWYRFLIQPDPYASLTLTVDSKKNRTRSGSASIRRSSRSATTSSARTRSSRSSSSATRTTRRSTSVRSAGRATCG